MVMVYIDTDDNLIVLLTEDTGKRGVWVEVSYNNPANNTPDECADKYYMNEIKKTGMDFEVS